MEPIVSVAWLVALVVGACAQPPAATSPHALYHLSAVRRSVDLAKRSLVTTSATRHVFKRSADVKADDLFLHSVASYCDSFRTNPDILAYFERSKANLPLKATDISGHAKFIPTQKLSDILNTGDMNPEVLPVKVQAQREGDVVWLIFHIAHSEAATISRIDPFDFQTSGLDMPQDSYQKVVSKARFHINVSSVCFGQKQKNSHLFSGFQMFAAEASHYTTTVHLNLCSFHKRWDNIGHRIQEMNDVISEDIEIPTLRLHTPSDDVILMDPNRDAQVNVQVNISRDSTLSVHLVLWDTESGNPAQSSAQIEDLGMSPGNVRIRYNNSFGRSHDNGQLFHVEVLNSSKPERHVTCTTVGIVVKKIAESQMGKLKLVLSYSRKESPLGHGDVVRRIRVERSLDVKHRDAGRGLHTPPVYFRPPHTFKCTENRGDTEEMEARFGLNCTVRCHAHGSDIASIFISRLGAHTLLVTSASYVLPGDAVAIMNVGEASPDNEGAYQCVAVDKQGRTSTVGINLYTSLLTRISKFFISTEHDHYGPQTATVTCVASGEDVDMSIYLSSLGKNETRIDTDERFNRNVTIGLENESSATLTITLPWSEMRHPRNFLRCLAIAVRGEEEKWIDLSSYPGNTYGVFPRVSALHPDTGVVWISDSEAIMRCVVSGQPPVRVWMSFQSPADRYPANETEYNDRTDVELRGETVTVSYYLRIGLGSYYRYYCKAKNAIAEDERMIYI